VDRRPGVTAQRLATERECRELAEVDAGCGHAVARGRHRHVVVTAAAGEVVDVDTRHGGRGLVCAGGAGRRRAGGVVSRAPKGRCSTSRACCSSCRTPARTATAAAGGPTPRLGRPRAGSRLRVLAGLGWAREALRQFKLPAPERTTGAPLLSMPAAELLLHFTTWAVAEAAAAPRRRNRSRRVICSVFACQSQPASLPSPHL
jgi:hypothetical protein